MPIPAAGAERTPKQDDRARKPTAAILAGGRARRFGGRPKPLLPLGDQRIIDRQIAALGAVADRIAVVTTDRERYGALGIPVWEDLIPGAGPLGGIYTALVRAAARTLVVAGDMPFLTPAFMRHLDAAGRDADIAVARTADGRHPLCGSYDAACAGVIRERLDRGALKVGDLLASVRVREIGPCELRPFDPHGTLFFNINTPEDYARGRQLAARRPS